MWTSVADARRHGAVDMAAVLEDQRVTAIARDVSGRLRAGHGVLVADGGGYVDHVPADLVSVLEVGGRASWWLGPGRYRTVADQLEAVAP